MNFLKVAGCCHRY